MLEFNCLSNSKIVEGAFFAIPKSILNSNFYMDNLGMVAIMLYGWMRDRLNLSCENYVFDDNGNPYITVTIPTMMRTLNVSSNTVKKALKELEKCKLIYFKKNESNKGRKIYLGEVDTKVYSYTCKKQANIDTTVRCKKYNSIGSKNDSFRGQKLPPNNIINNNYINNKYEYMKSFDEGEL